MKIEVLYFDGCPNHKPAVKRIAAVLQEEGITARVSELHVRDEAAAEALGFLGSPSIRVNGLDVELTARSSREYGMMCRTYMVEGRRAGLPSHETIRQAIREARSGTAMAGQCCPVSDATAGVDKSKSSSLIVAASVGVATAASLCCILPIVFALAGFSIVGAAAFFGGARPYLLGLTFILLAIGFYFVYRSRRESCALASGCATQPVQRSGRLVLWLATSATIIFATFPYYSGPVADILLPSSAGGSGRSTESAIAHASFGIEGMDCAACATAVERRLMAVAGVRRVTVSFELRRADIEYEPHSATLTLLERVIEDAGYRVRRS
jgi:copper chaperone CopZ